MSRRKSEVAELVEEWYRALPRPVRLRPTLSVPESEIRLLRQLLDEEGAEFQDAVDGRQLDRVADALADIVYVAYGAALQLGIDLDEVLREVHRANMSKSFADGRYEFDESGKVVRGDNYVPPALDWLLELSAQED